MISGNKTRKMIFIISSSYSGSTVLTFLLATHPKISTIGELKATAMGDIENYKCSCGQLIQKCSFWNNVDAEMNSNGKNFSLHNFGTHFKSDSKICNILFRAGVKSYFFETLRNIAINVIPICKNQFKAILEQNRLIIDIICSFQGGNIFLDSSKDPIRLKFLLSSNQWDIKVINIIRDGRGVINSYMRHYKVPIEAATKEWIISQKEINRMIKYLRKDNYLKVHYEDLCTKPKEVLSGIYKFIGIELDVVNPGYISNQHHILGNEMRLRTTNEIKLDEKWKNEMSKRDLEYIESNAGRYNVLLGYK